MHNIAEYYTQYSFLHALSFPNQILLQLTARHVCIIHKLKILGRYIMFSNDCSLSEHQLVRINSVNSMNN